MEIHKNTNKQLNDLFTEARHEKPVMNLKEVENIISEGKYSPAPGSRGFHIGMNNLIVVCGIVVSSFLAYMALKVDSGDLNVQAPSTVNSEAAQAPAAEQTTAAQPNPKIIPAAAQADRSGNQKKSSDRVQPKQDASTLLASTDKIVAGDNAAVEEIVEPVAAKAPITEWVVTFNYEGQDVRMKMIGEEISEFAVDGVTISADQYGDFDDILREGKNYLIGNTHADAGSSSLNLIKYFDGQLRADKILDNEVQYQFELNSSQLLVNGNAQSDEMFNKYKGLYEAKTGKRITKGSVYKFDRGAKSE